MQTGLDAALAFRALPPEAYTFRTARHTRVELVIKSHKQYRSEGRVTLDNEPGVHTFDQCTVDCRREAVSE